MVSHCLAVLSADVIDLQAGVPAGALAKKGGNAGDAFGKHHLNICFSQTRFGTFRFVSVTAAWSSAKVVTGHQTAFLGQDKVCNASLPAHTPSGRPRQR
jgi:hypothetical protein